MKGSAFLVCALLFCSVLRVGAEDFYVRPDGGTYGSENGSDWNNAFDGMPPWNSPFWGIGTGKIGPGDTVYVAGGSYYRPWRIEVSGTAGSPVTVRRATSAEHGTDSGWNPAFDSRVVITSGGIQIWKYDYIVIDGVVAGGIRVAVGNAIGVNLSPNVSNPSNYITLRYLEIEGPGANLGPTYANSRAIYDVPGQLHSGLTIEYCELHSYPTALVKIEDATGVLVQHSIMYDVKDYENHEDFIITYRSDGTLRYNTGYNTDASGFAFADNSGPWYVYGNLFFQTGSFIGVGNAMECQRNTELYCYNNTIVNFDHGLDVSTRAGYPASTGQSFNNLFYGNRVHFLDGPSFENNYNWYYPPAGTGGDNGEPEGEVGTIEPFLDYKMLDFHLAGATANGKDDLGSPFDRDMDDNQRGTGGVWDRGAYEFTSQTAPAKPSGLRVLN